MTERTPITTPTVPGGLPFDATQIQFTPAGTGAVARSVQNDLRENIKITQYGAIGDGITNDAASIQAALNRGGDIYFPNPAVSYFLGTTALTIGSNTRILFAKGAKFTATTTVQANLPQAFLQINTNATDVEIDGAFLDYVANPYTSYVIANLGAFIWVKSGAQRIKIRRCRTMWPMHSVYSSLTDAAITDLTITDNDFTSVSTDVALLGTGLANPNISWNRFPIARPAGLGSPGNVHILSGTDFLLAAPPFTQSNFDNDYASNVVISNNISFQPANRPYRLNNIVGLTMNGNQITALVGKSRAFGGTSCDDLFTLNFIRDFSLTGNTTYGGGQNGVDILSCQKGSVTGNTLYALEVSPIYADVAETFSASGTSPKLSGLTDRTTIANREVVVSDNTLNGSSAVIYGGNLQGVSFNNNKLSFNKVATNRTVSEPILIAVSDQSSGSASYTAEGRNMWMSSFRFSGNTYDQGTTKSVTVVAATDIFTSLTNHEFTTGDRIEFYTSGTAVTWAAGDFPAGATYYTEYYAIVLSATTFKIATTYANAQAGTAVDITNAGLATAGTVLLVGLARGFANLSLTNIDPNMELQLDENIPVTLPAQLFSTLASFAPGNPWLWHWKFELIADPTIDYGSGNTKAIQGKYLPVHNRKYYDGTNTYGVEVTVMVQNTYVIVKGTRIAQVAGATDGRIRASFW
jgi:hypothetical protein